ncbi:hypothetical protein V493_02621 [Pseudogymnoascus sp. VKM F-4281 (FW-2241)]|nr:hypothetical protein V493_02621 [Pseudogymnoascus sp. VKM F-4281 (FW-2241)]
MALLGWSYRDEPYDPFWGPTSSKANFCEEDYIVTRYIAELINTLTNLTYILYAIHGIYKNWGRKDAFLRNIPYLGIMGVGFGSAIFHATNKYYTQWADDLSMLLATATVMHRVYTYDNRPLHAVLKGLGLAVFLTLFSVWHCLSDEIVGHAALFGVMVVLVGLKTRSIISHRVEDPVVKKEVRKLVWWGSAIFISGYVIWNIDNFTCSWLTHAKRKIGMPLSFLLELHGWWHIFTGIGAYIFIALVEYLTSEEAGEPLTGRFAWPIDMFLKKPRYTPSIARTGYGTLSEAPESTDE